ncbi:MAG: 50S ribosomal protein L30e [Thermoplasmata archaeon]|nr:MAG: 50S ribosomal protein L30e [Thermoplasmata archaeon]
MDIEKELSRVLSSGKVKIGFKEALRTEDAKMYIVSRDCPRKKELMEMKDDVPMYVYHGNNIELGKACGKPFGISVITIIDEGKSNILELVK